MESTTRPTFGLRAKILLQTTVDQAVVSRGPATARVVDREAAVVAARAQQPGTQLLFTPAVRQRVLTALTIRPTSGRRARTPRQTMVDQEAVRRGPSSVRAVLALQFRAYRQG